MTFKDSKGCSLDVSKVGIVYPLPPIFGGCLAFAEDILHHQELVLFQKTTVFLRISIAPLHPPSSSTSRVKHLEKLNDMAIDLSPLAILQFHVDLPSDNLRHGCG